MEQKIGNVMIILKLNEIAQNSTRHGTYLNYGCKYGGDSFELAFLKLVLAIFSTVNSDIKNIVAHCNMDYSLINVDLNMVWTTIFTTGVPNVLRNIYCGPH